MKISYSINSIYLDKRLENQISMYNKLKVVNQTHHINKLKSCKPWRTGFLLVKFVETYDHFCHYNVLEDLLQDSGNWDFLSKNDNWVLHIILKGPLKRY